MAVNSGKSNLSVGLRLLLRLSPRPSRSPALRLSSEPAKPRAAALERPGVARRRGRARAGGGEGLRGARCGARCAGGRWESGLPCGGTRARAAQSCPAMELRGPSCRRAWLVLAGSHIRQRRPPWLEERTVVTRCTRGYASLRYYAHLLLLCGVGGKREIYPEFCLVVHTESGNVQLVSHPLSIAKDLKTPPSQLEVLLSQLVSVAARLLLQYLCLCFLCMVPFSS